MRPWQRRLAIGLLATLAAPPLACASSFTESVIDFNGPPILWGLSSADMNGDGKPDLLAGSHSPNSPGLYWYRNPDWRRTTISTKEQVGTGIRAIDLYGNGVLDVVATTDTGGVTGITLFRPGSNGWTAKRIISGARLHDIRFADLNGDGLIDIVGRGQYDRGNTLFIWLQRPDKTWKGQPIALPAENGQGVQVADIDRDGKQDIILPRYWFHNTSSHGKLLLKRHTYSAKGETSAIVGVADLDGDNIADIVLSPADHPGTFGRISWYKTPAQPFSDKPWQETVIEGNIERDHHTLALLDWDRDGHKDIMTAMTEKTKNPKVKIYYNKKGIGLFGSPFIVAFKSSHQAQAVRIGKDKYVSIVGANYDKAPHTTIRLWRQRP